MVGIAIEVDAPELREAMVRLGALAHVVDANGADLTDVALGVAINGAVRRIQDEKRSPEGAPWAAWSSLYGETRHAGQTILNSEEHLLQSIADPRSKDANQGHDDEKMWLGSNLVYAAIHQLGGDTEQGHPPIPARPYLGLSPADRDELREDITTFLEQLL